MAKYDRVVKIQQKKQFSVFEPADWVTLATVWANVDQTGTSEKFNNDAARLIPLRNAEFRILWRAGLREDYRLIYSALIWDIKGIKEIGYRGGLVLICQSDVSRTA